MSRLWTGTSLDKFHIFNTRSLHEDTDHVNFSLKIGGAALESLTRDTGDVNNGDHLVGLSFGPFRIQDPAVPIIFNYQIVNGSYDPEEIKTTLKQAAEDLATSAANKDWPTVARLLLQKYGPLIVLHLCDGPVAGSQVSTTGPDLIRWTQGEGIYTETRDYPGTDSPVGCGSNSHYSVTWSVIRL
jgi:hypothetical protein